MRLRPRSVRLRLTLWYVGAFTSMIAAFSVGIYLFVRAALMKEVDGQLRKDQAALETILREEPGEIGELEEHGTAEMFRVSENDRVVYATQGWERAGLEEALKAAGPGTLSPWMSAGGHPYFLRSSSIRAGGRLLRVAVARDGRTVRDSLRTLAMTLLLGVPCAMAAAVIGGYLLAGALLAPVSAMAEKAKEISAECLSERLPVENPQDEFGRLAAVFNDTLTRLEAAFERLRRFTSDASHELRTPLTALRSVGEVGVQRDGDAAYYRDVIGSMLEETDRLARLVDGLLVLTRADSPRTELRRVPVALGRFVREVADCLGALAEDKGQELLLRVDDPGVVAVDRAIFRQALLNLLDNAIKFAPEGGKIGLRVSRTANGESVVEVTDDGPGIPPEDLERIFDRFYRVERNPTREAPGTGLGLAIARWAVQAHGGRIEVESEIGRGSTFRIVLPPEKGGDA